MWILTFETNDYDQHGEYFHAAWIDKPHKESLSLAINCKEDDPLIEHVLSGGGRINSEYQWYHLSSFEEGESMDMRD